MATPENLPSPVSRDLRIDALRGLSLLMIYTDHVGWLGGNTLLRDRSLAAFALTDCANVFVFISGYVAGLVYGRDLDLGGFRRLWRRTADRALQLYSWHLVTLAATVVLVTVVAAGGVDVHTKSRLLHVFVHPWKAGFAALGLVYAPYAFDVLRFYILFLLALPFWLWLFDRRPLLALVVSVLLYALPNIDPGIAVHDWPDGRPWYFNPLGWQFLFFLGAALSRRGLPGPAAFWRSQALLVAACLLLAAGVFARVCGPRLFEPGGALVPFVHDELAYGFLPWSGKTEQQPLRLLSFLALALVTVRLLPAGLGLWRSRFAAPVIACGQNALRTYCLSLVLVYGAAALLAEFGAGDGFVVAVTVGGWVVMGVYALGCTRLRRDRPRA